MKKIRSTLVLMSAMIAVFAAFIFSEKSTFATIDSGDTSKTLFEQLKSEVAGVSDGAVIDLPAGEYVFTEEISISGKKISFRNNGQVSFKRAPSYKGNMIKIAEDGGLTIDSPDNGLIFDAENKESNGSFIYTNGKLVINGGSFKNDYNDQISGSGPIKAEKPGASIIFNAGIVENNNYMRNAAYSSGGFYLGDGAEMEMNGGTIRKNQGTTYDYPATPTGFWSDSPGGGAVFVANGAKFTMNGGDILENKGWGGGVFVGSASPYDYDRTTTDPNSLKTQKKATAVFNGGSIKNNKGIGGGVR